MSQQSQATTTLPARGLARVVTLPPPAPGFIGAGHVAVHVIDGRDFTRTDPFIMLADDRVDLPPGRKAGGAHPHAGFEIVTFVVEGEARDRDEGALRTGDVAWMTAGSGVVHNEDFEPMGPIRILQLWVTLPTALRWASPRFAVLQREQAVVRRVAGAEARVYSGQSGDVQVPGYLHLPLTLIDISLEPGGRFEQALPANYNGFLYPLDGVVEVDDATPLTLGVGSVGWLAPADVEASVLRLSAPGGKARVLLYAGERQGVPILSHGPFIGETHDDLVRVSRAYVDGRMPRVSDLVPGR